MKRLKRQRWLALLSAAVVAVGLFPWTARPVGAAFDMPATRCAQSVEPGTGRQVVTLDCQPGFATDHDRVTIYSRGPSGEAPGDPAQFDTRDAVWLFDAGATGRASLIIDFHPDGAALLADLYDDQGGDGHVGYALRDGFPQVTEVPVIGRRMKRGTKNAAGTEDLVLESRGDLPEAFGVPMWTVRVRAADGWWVGSAGQPNMNLDLQVDGAVMAAFTSELYLDRIQTDGAVDYTIQVRDPDRDGQPDYEIRQARPRISESSGYYRTIVNAAPVPDRLPILGAILWPYLGRSGPPQSYGGGRLPTVPLQDAQGSYGYVRDYGQRFPPIQVDWERGQIVYVGEFVPSRSGEHNWFVYSIDRLEPGGNTVADFENPFAFYDLAGDDDGYPELQVRMELHPPFDQYGPQPPRDQPTEVVRYSWDQDNQRSWDFKLDLLGRYPVQDEVQFPEITVRTVPYQRLPGWVVERPWDAATFVAAERPYWTSEGIYEWSAIPLRDAYLKGDDLDDAVAAAFSDIPIGLRGEVQGRSGRQAWLYGSAVDHKLHLRGAERGVWNIDDLHRLRYARLGGDAYLKQWRYTDASSGTEQTVRELDVANGQAIYADEQGVALQELPVPPALFETLPPTTTAEWQTLGQLLAEHPATSSASDPRAMFASIATPKIELTGASLHDFRLSDDGFRFSLDLPASATAGAGGWPSWLPAEAGSYVVVYTPAAGFVARPFEAAAPRLLSLAASTAEPTALVPLQLRAELVNDGQEDLHRAKLRFIGQNRLGRVFTLATRSIDLLAEQRTAVTIDWAPPSGGPWSCYVTIDDGPPLEPRLAAEVAPAADSGWLPLVEAQAQTAPDLLLEGLSLLAVGLIASVVALAVWAPRATDGVLNRD